MAKTIGPRKTWYSQKSIRAKRGERNQFLESHLSFSLFRWNLTYSLLKNQTFLILVFFLCPTRTCTHVSTANGKKAMWSNEMSVCARHVMLHSKTTLYEFRKRRRRRGKKNSQSRMLMYYTSMYVWDAGTCNRIRLSHTLTCHVLVCARIHT